MSAAAADEAVRALQALKRDPGSRIEEDVFIAEDYLLRNCAFFDQLTNDTRRQFVQVCEYVTMPTLRVLFNQGDAGDYFYVILSGSVSITVADPNSNFNRDILVTNLEEGQSFGELSLSNDTPRSAKVTTLEQSEFLVLDKGQYLRILGGQMKNDAGSKIDFLRGVLLFKNMSTKQLEMLASVVTLQVLAAGAVVVKEGDVAEDIFIVKRGQARVIKSISLDEDCYQLLVKLRARRFDENESRPVAWSQNSNDHGPEGSVSVNPAGKKKKGAGGGGGGGAPGSAAASERPSTSGAGATPAPPTLERTATKTPRTLERTSSVSSRSFRGGGEAQGGATPRSRLQPQPPPSPSSRAGSTPSAAEDRVRKRFMGARKTLGFLKGMDSGQATKKYTKLFTTHTFKERQGASAAQRNEQERERMKASLALEVPDSPYADPDDLEGSQTDRTHDRGPPSAAPSGFWDDETPQHTPRRQRASQHGSGGRDSAGYMWTGANRVSSDKGRWDEVQGPSARRPPHRPKGRKVFLETARLLKGDYFGEVGVAQRRRRFCSVVTLQETELYVLNKWDFHRLLSTGAVNVNDLNNTIQKYPTDDEIRMEFMQSLQWQYYKAQLTEEVLSTKKLLQPPTSAEGASRFPPVRTISHTPIDHMTVRRNAKHEHAITMTPLMIHLLKASS